MSIVRELREHKEAFQRLQRKGKLSDRQEELLAELNILNKGVN